jgi:hypothetical protein
MASNSNDSNETYLIIGVLVLAGIYYWLTHSPYLLMVWKWIRLAELTPFYFMPSWVPIWGDLEIQKAWHFLYSTPAEQLHTSTAMRYDAQYPRWFRWIFAIPVAIYGLKQVGKIDRFTETFTDESLLRRWAPMYPHLLRFVDNNPNKKPMHYRRGNKESYSYGVALTPDEFARLTPPLGLESESKKDSSLKAPIWDGKNDFDADLAERAFRSQLGELYSSVEALSPLHRKVFDIMMERVMMPEVKLYEFIKKYLTDYLRPDTKKKYPVSKVGYGHSEMITLLGTLADEKKEKTRVAREKKIKALIRSGKIHKSKTGLIEKKLLRSEILSDNTINEFLENELVDKVSQKVMSRLIMEGHAYISTGLMTLITEARKTGVFSVYTEMCFLKPESRVLWFALQSAGRNTAFSEAAGIMAHHQIEVQIGRPLRQAEVFEAVSGLKTALLIEDDQQAASGYQL